MAERDWLRPEAPETSQVSEEARGTAGARGPAARFALRPLSLGEVLDRIFSLYRSRFWLFAGISMIAATVYTVAQGISLTAASRMARHAMAAPPNSSPMAALANLRVIGTAQAGTYLVMLVYFLVSAVTQAGTAWAMAELYLGRTADAPGALRHVAPRWPRWIGIALWQVGSAVWVPVALLVPGAVLLGLSTRGSSVGLAVVGGVVLSLAVFAGIPAAVMLYLRNALAIPAAAIEGLPVRRAMRRSKALTKGTKGRLFIVLLVAYVLLEVAGVLEAPLSLFIVLSRGSEHYLMRGLALLVTFVGHTVVAPVAALGMTLVYFDQRVRKEALDLELLLEDARGTEGGPGASSRDGAREPEDYAPSL